MSCLQVCTPGAAVAHGGLGELAWCWFGFFVLLSGVRRNSVPNKLVGLSFYWQHPAL